MSAYGMLRSISVLFIFGLCAMQAVWHSSQLLQPENGRQIATGDVSVDGASPRDPVHFQDDPDIEEPDVAAEVQVQTFVRTQSRSEPSASPTSLLALQHAAATPQASFMASERTRVHQASLELSRMLNETVTERKRAVAERDELEASAKRLRRARDLVESTDPLDGALGHHRQRKIVVQAVIAVCSCFVVLGLVWCGHTFCVGRPRDIGNETPRDIHGTGPFDTGASKTPGGSSMRTSPQDDLFVTRKNREPKSCWEKLQRIPGRCWRKFKEKHKDRAEHMEAWWTAVSGTCNICAHCDANTLMYFWVVFGIWVAGLVVFWHFEVVQPVLGQVLVFVYLFLIVGFFGFVVLTEMYGGIGGLLGDFIANVKALEQKMEKVLKVTKLVGHA